MGTCVKIYGKKREALDEDWQEVICHVSYSSFDTHRKVVEDSFRYHLNLDLEDMKENHSDHFTDPQNVGRAILLYHYFRNRHCFFEDNRCEIIPLKELPTCNPDDQGLDYKLWVSEAQKL
jgi:hypothetical protein